MAADLYMDVHVQSAITQGLCLRRVDVVTAQDDESIEWSDDDFLAKATRLQAEQRPCASVVYAHQQGASIGQCGAIWK